MTELNKQALRIIAAAAKTSLAVILNAAKRAHEESATAAGISIKGE